ncbi:protein amnionless-like isoform X2 [Belonocnema kinseyi]|uniref:protein amnionless-like isoform X2 n=1 Tax=Belonocnema kinseyi TaxID=2817044 RepID=UPI00143D2480|nr:protein amnionless-like isoform X2 [Belonocnema kinseyi]
MRNMCQLKKVLRIFLLLGLNELSQGLKKHWLPNQEWNCENNWIDGRVPDMDSHVIFPLEMRHIAGVPVEGDLRLSKIDLPTDGALVLAKNGALKIIDKPQKEAKIGRWSREGQLFWADPQNWNSTSEAVPHLERLPCQMDYTILPGRDRVFNMRLPMKEVQVKSIWLNNEETEIGFSEWYQRVRGREFSSSRASVSYSQLQGCERCMCQEGKQSEYLEEVCDIQRPRCVHSTCEYPLRVEGHCCDYCGARLSLLKKVYTRSVNRLTNEALSPYDTTISWYVRTTWEGSVEILIAEKGQYSGIRSQEALQNLEFYLKEEGIDVLRTENSGKSLQNNRLEVVLIPLFGGLILVMAFLLVIFPYYGYSYTHGRIVKLFLRVRKYYSSFLDFNKWFRN